MLAGVAPASAADRALFFALTKRLFERYRFKRLTTAALHAWLGENVAEILRDAGHAVSGDDVRTKLAAWRAAWFHQG